MSVPIFDTFPQMQKAFEPAIELNMEVMKEVTKNVNAMVHENLGMFNAMAHMVMDQVQELRHMERWDEVGMASQQWMNKISKPMTHYSQHALDSMLEMAGKCGQWMEKCAAIHPHTNKCQQQQKKEKH